jgi:maltose O-acetyltransferase
MSFKRIIKWFIKKLISLIEQVQDEEVRKKLNLGNTIHLYNVEVVGNNVFIGEYTYINRGTTLSSGKTSKIQIGKYCAIGRYVHISAKRHDFEIPTADENYSQNNEIEADVYIGNYVWIGDKVFIKEGVTIGDYAIIGANSVVNRNVLAYEIVGGVPIRHIRFNDKHYTLNRNK